MADFYLPQVEPRRSTDALRPASPRAFGAELGAAVVEAAGEVGDAVERAREIEERREREAQAAAAGAEMARRMGEWTVTINGLRERAAPGAGGHVATVEASIDPAIDQFLEGIPDERVRAQFRTQAAQVRARLVGEEDGWARGRRVTFQSTNVQEAARTYANYLQTRPSEAAWREGLANVETSVTAAEVSADLGTALVRDQQAVITDSYVQGRIEQDPAAALAEIQAGRFNTYVTPARLAQLTDAAQVEVRVRDADARRVAVAAQAEVRARAEMMERRLRDHDPRITDDELAALQRDAAAAGLPDEVYDAGRARIRQRADREYRNANPVEIRAAIGAIDARIAQAGTRASPEDAIARDHLASLLTQREQAVQNDPLGAYQRAGGVVAPLNFADPASLRARVTASRAAQRQTGYLQVLMPQETALLREQAASGPQGRLAAINQLAAIGAVDPAAALDAARQVAPNDPAFRHALRVNPRVRELVAAGAEARRTLGQRIERGDGSTGTVDGETQAWFLANAQAALVSQQPDFVNETLEAARNIYAETLRRQGSAPDRFHPDLFGQAVNLALGATRRGGGVGRWGGARGRPFLLPTGMPQEEFERRMAGLEGRHPRGFVNGEAVFSDGSHASAAQIRAGFTPVAVADGIYEFQRGNQVLRTRGGQNFRLNIRLVAPAAERFIPTPRDRRPRRIPTLGGQ